MDVEFPPLRVAITGVTVSGNMGGTAMLQTTMQEIARLAPGSRFTLLSYMPAADRALPPIPGLTVVSADFRLLVPVFMPVALILYPLLALAPMRRLLRAIPYFRALDDADVVIDLCGIAFSDGRGPALLAYNVACVLPAAAMRKPVMKLSQALGPFKERLNRFLARRTLSACRLVVARGQGSFEHVRELGIANSHVLPDTTFCLTVDEAARAQAREILNRHGVGPGAVVVSPSEVVRRLCANADIDFEAGMADFLARLADDGEQIVLLPHSLAKDGSKNNDLDLCRRLKAKLGDRVALIEGYEDPILLRAIIGGGAAHIGCRFHGVVGALAMGLPTMIIGWSHKYREMAEPLQSARWGMDWRDFSADRAYGFYQGFRAERVAIAAMIAENLPAVVDGARQNYRLALDALSEGAARRG